MSLFEDLCKALPELTVEDFLPDSGSIVLQDDADGKGAFIAKWNHSSELPQGFKIGK